MHWGAWISSFLFLLLVPLIPLLPQTPSPAGAQPIARKILAIYDDNQYADPFLTFLHLKAQMPLNHLGMDMEFHPLSKPFPTKLDPKIYRGIMTWFSDAQTIGHPFTYCQWLNKNLDMGIKWVFLGHPGFLPLEEGKPIPRPCQETLVKMGVEFWGMFTEYPLFLEVVDKNPEMAEFERRLLPEEMTSYVLLKRSREDVVSYLSLRRTDRPDSLSSMIFTSKGGGGAYGPYALYLGKDDKTQWRINPFRFFEEGLALKGIPRPDTSTRNGTRIFYTHIDGDGIFNISHIDRKTFSGELIYREVLKVYSGIPISASIITGYLDFPKFYNDRSIQLYKSIFKLPHVEPTAHGHGHPMAWQKGAKDIDKFSRYTHTYKTDDPSGELAIKPKDYVYNPIIEIAGSVKRINEELEKWKIPKKVELFQWTGDCLPSGDIIKISYDHGILNINGGDTRFDKEFPSYSHVAPLGIVKKKALQVFASNSNENLYTNLWGGPYFGFQSVVETFENTESPRRIKPINVYYHYYSGERSEALIAVKRAYTYALGQEIFPMFASEYARLVQDFFGLSLERIGDGGVRVKNNGHLRTLRFDEENQNVDLKKSTGVLGYRHYQNNLYVHLDEAKEHDIYLTNAGPNQVYVERATFDIQGFQATQEGIQFQKKGWHTSQCSLAGLNPNLDYQVQSEGEKQVLKSSPEGKLDIRFQTAENFQPATQVTIRPILETP
jgi:hypothetical protein